MIMFMIAAYITALGLCAAGAGTYLYQGLAKQQAMLRFDGKTYVGTLGHLAMSLICGPYIMLQLGWRHEPGETMSATTSLMAALLGFGWAFITGALMLELYLAITGA